MISEAVELRPLEVPDKDFLVHMSYQALKGSFKNIPPLGEPVVTEAVAANVEEWGKKGDAGLIAETAEFGPAGAAWCRLFPDRFTALGEGRTYTPVVTMAVREEARGSGLGRALLEGLMDNAADDGVPRFNLSVAMHNTVAKRLYDSVGFTDVKRYLAFFDSQFAPAIKMTALTARTRQ